jgi:hypothetical protein
MVCGLTLYSGQRTRTQRKDAGSSLRRYQRHMPVPVSMSLSALPCQGMVTVRQSLAAYMILSHRWFKGPQPPSGVREPR